MTGRVVRRVWVSPSQAETDAGGPLRVRGPSALVWVQPVRASAWCFVLDVRVPSAVLLELYRGGGTDEPIDQELGRGYARVVTTGVRIARIAGHILAEAGRGSELAVDALVVATTIRLGGGMILTHDPGDLELLVINYPNVRVVAV